MLHVRKRINRINVARLTDFEDIEWRGQSLADLAADEDVAAICSASPRTVKRGDPQWERPLPDEDRVTFIVSDQGIEITAGAIIALAIKAAVVAVVGTLVTSVLGKFLAPSANQPGKTGRRNEEQSPVYGFDGIENNANQNAVIPLVFGHHKLGGQILRATRMSTDEDAQRLRVMLCLGEGPFHSIGQYQTDQDLLSGENLPDGMTINGIDAKELKGVTCSLRMGNMTQTHMPGFEFVEREYEHNFRLEKETGIPFKWKSRDKVNGFKINLTFPSGLFKVSTSPESPNEIKKIGVELRVTIFRRSDQAEVFNEEYEIRRKTQAQIWHTIRIKNLAPDYYDVKVERIDAASWRKKSTHRDQVDLIAINEIQDLTLTYPGLVLIGLDMQASEQLRGGFPRILSEAKGLKVNTPSGIAWTQNNADIFRAVASNPDWGGGVLIQASDIDEEDLDDWRDWCDELIEPWTGAALEGEDPEPRHRCDVVFDRQISLLEMLLQIASLGRAVPVKFGNTWRIKIEKPRVPTQVFTQGGNIRRGSLKITYKSKRDRPNRVEVNFLDQDDDWNQTSVAEEVGFLDEALGQVIEQSQDGFGQTRETEARRHAAYLLRNEQKISAFIEFEALAESMLTEALDVATIAHAFVGFGESGRLAGTSSGNVLLDRELTFEAGTLYTYLEVDKADGSSQSRDFTASGSLSELPFAPIFGAVDAIGRQYIVGPKLKAGKPWVIQQITSLGDNSPYRLVKGFEYIDDIYSDAATKPGLQLPGESGDPPPPVTNIAAVETSTVPGVSHIALSWDEPFSLFDLRYRVFWRDSNQVGSETLVAEVSTNSAGFDLPNVRLGQTVDFVVQTVEETGREIRPENSPSLSYTITREDDTTTLVTFPATPTNLALTPDGGTPWFSLLTWDAVAGADGYEIRWAPWSMGLVVKTRNASDPNALQAPIWHTRVGIREVEVRAKIGNYYSPDGARIAVGAVQFSDFSVESQADHKLDFTAGDRWNSFLKNYAVQRPGQFARGETIVQTYADEEVGFTSITYDLGSAADTQVSAFVKLRPWLIPSIGALGLFGSMKHWSFSTGEINKVYQTFNIYIEYRTGTSGDWTRFDWVHASNQSDVVINARQFRIRVEAMTQKVYARIEGEIDDAIRITKTMIEECRLALHRRP